jgi:hypothetical protein
MNPAPVRKPSSAEIKAAVRKPSWQPTHAWIIERADGSKIAVPIVRSRMVGRSRYP